MKTSSCCDAAIHNGRCSDCQEHASGGETCPDCEGTGEVSTMEQVYPGEPHMAPIGTAPCPRCGGTGVIESEDAE